MNKKTRALNDYTANLPEKQRQAKMDKFKEPLKAIYTPDSNSPMEPRQKKSFDYVIAP